MSEAWSNSLAQYASSQSASSSSSAYAGSSSSASSSSITRRVICPNRAGKNAKIYGFQLDLSSEGTNVLSIPTNSYQCCYDAEVPQCVPSLCIGDCCQSCMA